MNLSEAIQILTQNGYNIPDEDEYLDPLDDDKFVAWMERNHKFAFTDNEEYIEKLYKEFKKLQRLNKDFE